MTHKLTVITDEAGQVVATKLGHGDAPNPATGITSRLVAGPGQHEHKIEFDVPVLRTRADIAAFHEQLTSHLADRA